MIAKMRPDRLTCVNLVDNEGVGPRNGLGETGAARRVYVYRNVVLEDLSRRVRYPYARLFDRSRNETRENVRQRREFKELDPIHVTSTGELLLHARDKGLEVRRSDHDPSRRHLSKHVDDCRRRVARGDGEDLR
jgi:hypothetical protein